MTEKRRLTLGIISALGLLFIILDVKTAMAATKSGITLCLYTVIPSLFPFLVVTYIVNATLSGTSMKLFQPLTRLCKVPIGHEALFILGFLGGYPIGAKNIYDAYNSGCLSRREANRLLGFCNNAGPSFIFGFLSCLFEQKYISWLLWLIHIITACLVGIFLPKADLTKTAQIKSPSVSLTKAVKYAVTTMGIICGWIIAFRIMLFFLQRWLLFLFPETFQIFIAGILELSNGCIALRSIPVTGTRFVLASFFLGFGGLCVSMQTVSVTKDLGPGYYFTGKILHSSMSVLLAGIIQFFIFESTQRCDLSIFSYVIPMCIVSGVLIHLARKKKTVAIACKV